MDNNFVNPGGGTGPVTRAMVQARARELALSAGRAPAQVSATDYELAKRELTGESDLDRQDAILDSIPVPEAPGGEGDAAGRNKSEQLFAQGLKEAERDRALQAAERKDQRGP